MTLRPSFYSTVAASPSSSPRPDSPTRSSCRCSSPPAGHRDDRGVDRGLHGEHPDVTFEIELRRGGSEGDNIVKTRLATGEMADIFQYNSGSLFQALRPTHTLADLSDLPARATHGRLQVGRDRRRRRLRRALRGRDGRRHLLQHQDLRKLGLSVPKTWDEFMANNEKIKAAGKVAVAQTYRDTWTSQLFVLADYYNVQAEAPTFAEDYTANKAKYATTPGGGARLRAPRGGLQGRLHERGLRRGHLRRRGRMVATGEAAHYPMLTFAIGEIQQNYPETSTTSDSSPSRARTPRRTA